MKNCFAAGTPVATETGLKSIDAIRPGDHVWSYDLVASQWRLCLVHQTFELPYHGQTVSVTVADDTVEATSLHPFWVVSGIDLAQRPIRNHLARVPIGATTPGRWVDAIDLQVGDLVLLRNGERYPIQAVRVQPYHDTVYNFEVDNLHNYAVGASQVLVHNDNGSEAFEKMEDKARDLERKSKKANEARKRGNDAATDIAKDLGLNDFQKRMLHDQITKRGYSLDEIFDIALQIKGG